MIINRKELLSAVTAVSSIIKKNNAIPILDNIKIVVEGNSMNLFSSDLEKTMSFRVHVKSEEDNSFLIPHKVFLDLLRNLKDNLVEIVKGETLLSLKTNYGIYEIPYYDAADFPVETVAVKNVFKIKADRLKEAMQKASIAVGRDELRPVFSGILFDFEKGFSIVSTDAHKLVKIDCNENIEHNGKIIVPSSAVNSLNYFTEDIIDVSYDEKNITFSEKNIFATFRLIDGTYPNYDAVIPKNNEKKLSVDRDKLIDSLKRVSLFVDKGSQIVRLTIKNNLLFLSANNVDYAQKAEEKIVCESNIDNFEIGLNSTFLLNLLSKSNKIVNFSFSEPNKAVLIENTDSTMLIMPLLLN
jgi:DNA polymerase-3 subunit beta